MNVQAARDMPPLFLYFDLGNVILDFDHRRSARQMAAVADVDAERVWQVVFESDLLRRYELGRIGTPEFYDAFCAATGSRPDFDALVEAGCAMFDANATILPVVAQLEAAGHRLGILSNTNPSHWNYCAGQFEILRSAFEVTILSYEVHALKPDPAIYRVARDRAGVPAEDVFFVDDRTDNVEGARQAGFDAVLYTDTIALVRDLRRRGVQFNF